jgi:hypothetical protein
MAAVDVRLDINTGIHLLLPPARSTFGIDHQQADSKAWLSKFGYAFDAEIAQPFTETGFPPRPFYLRLGGGR